MKRWSLLLLSACLFIQAKAQDVRELLKQVKAKYDLVNDYSADGTLKTNVQFMKTPVATVKVYYKKPDKLKIRNESGVSFVPKGAVNINMNNVLALENFEALEGASEKIAGISCRVVKIFPLSDEENISRATLYIDAVRKLVIKSVITTRENGTYELLLTYNKYASWGLPDRVELTFSTREYKLPKGISIDYDNGTSKNKPANGTDNKNQKGKVEITYTSYVINKGVPDEQFR